MAAIALTALVAFCGCGGSQDGAELGLVTGTVTLDGAPVQYVLVRFEPKGAAMSSGATDASGRYELRYANGAKGAVLGTHTVRIEGLDAAEAAEIEGGAKPVNIPARYNLATTLTAEVKAGDNTINFDLVSKKK